MPRQDVPYPTGAICRLRERIGELFDLLGQKLHSVNGVEGDGQGNVTIKSGDPAVVINNDQAQHEIEIALDTSQLPAAAVSSVNGQTGVVALTADDIPSDNGDVQTDLDNLEAADTTLQGNINAEALARQNADSTLQTNINTITASLPGAVTAAVAADTTIVRTSGNQNIADVKTVATQATGSYSQQIANSQKVKNELDNYAPMIRNVNNQTKTGNLTFYESDIIIFGSDAHELVLQSRWMPSTITGYSSSMPQIEFVSSDNVVLGRIGLRKNSGRFEIYADIRNNDMTAKTVILARADN